MQCGDKWYGMGRAETRRDEIGEDKIEVATGGDEQTESRKRHARIRALTCCAVDG